MILFLPNSTETKSLASVVSLIFLHLRFLLGEYLFIFQDQA